MANSIIGKLFIFPSMWGAIIMTNLSLSFVSRWVGRRTVRTSAGVDGSAAGHIYQVLGQWEAGVCHCNEREVLARRVSRNSIFISELCVVDVGGTGSNISTLVRFLFCLRYGTVLTEAIRLVRV